MPQDCPTVACCGQVQSNVLRATIAQAESHLAESRRLTTSEPRGVAEVHGARNRARCWFRVQPGESELPLGAPDFTSRKLLFYGEKKDLNVFGMTSPGNRQRLGARQTQR